MQTKNLTKIIQDQTGGNHKIKKEDYLNSGKFPIIDQGQQFIGGYTNEKGLLCKVELPCIIFGDHTRIFKYIDFPFAMGADGVKVLKCNDELDTKYAYCFLKQTKLGGKQGYNRNFKYLKEVNIPLPPLATQRAIADKLDKLQSLIDLKKQAITKTDDLAKSIFLEMFGDPMVNEKGWEMREIRKLISETESTNPLKTLNERYNYIDISTVDNVSKEIIGYKTFSGKDAPSRARQIVYKNDILISTVRPNLNAVAIVREDIKNYLCSTGFCILRCGDEIVHRYLLEIVKSNFFVDNMVKVAKGASYPAISDNNVKDFKIPLPPLSLQQKFADIITEIESQKSAHKETLEKLENLYHSEMQRSFSS